MAILDELFERDKPPEDESSFNFDKTILDGYEAIQSLCCFSKWKGIPRQKSTLTISYHEGLWSARLNDYENSRSFSSTGVDAASALESLDRVLCGNKVNWYTWTYASKSKKKGK